MERIIVDEFRMMKRGLKYTMKELFIKQKLLSLNEKFTIKNKDEEDVYYVEGSFMRIPKTFSIMNASRDEVATITKKIFSFLPMFFVEVDNREIVRIKKEFTFFKARYTIDVPNLEVHGNWWDMDFQLLQAGEVIAEVSKQWFTVGDHYQVQILDEAMETIIIAIVVAIDCAKDEAEAAAINSAML